MGRESAFAEPFILKSEHKRILESAQQRYDEQLALRERVGYWRGIGQTVWITGGAVFLALLVGFYFGLSLLPG